MLDLTLVGDEFQSSIDGEDVLIDRYVAAYAELNKIFPVLGNVFKFVSKDVNSKISILETKRTALPESYKTVRSMVKHETEFAILTSDQDNGCRTLLRLHRALAFVVEFMNAIYETTNENISEPVWSAYSSTLSEHHPWLIRKTVGGAMYTLPTRSAILLEVGGKDALPRLVSVIRSVYDSVQLLFSENSLLTLK